MIRGVNEIIKGLNKEEVFALNELINNKANELMHQRWDKIVQPIEEKFFELNSLIDSAEIGIADSFFKEHGDGKDNIQ